MVQRSDWRSKKEKIKFLDRALNKGVSSRRSGGSTAPIASLEGIVYLLDQPPGEITLASINSLTAWYIADDSYITTEAPNDKVTYWQDVSGQGNDLEALHSGGVSNALGLCGAFYKAGSAERFASKSYVLFNDARMENNANSASLNWRNGNSGSDHTIVLYFELTAEENDDRDILAAIWEGREFADDESAIEMGNSWGGFEGNDYIYFGDIGTRFFPLTGGQYFHKDSLMIGAYSSSRTGGLSDSYNGFPSLRDRVTQEFTFTTRSYFQVGGIDTFGGDTSIRVREVAFFNSCLSQEEVDHVYAYFLTKYSDTFSTGSAPTVEGISGTFLARYTADNVLVDGGVVVALSDSSGLNNHLDLTVGTVITQSYYSQSLDTSTALVRPEEDMPMISFSGSYIENSNDFTFPAEAGDSIDKFTFYCVSKPRQRQAGGTGSHPIAEIFVSGSPTEPLLSLNYYNDITNDTEWGVTADPAYETSVENQQQITIYFGAVRPDPTGTGSNTWLWSYGFEGSNEGTTFKEVYFHTGSKIRLGATGSEINHPCSASFLEAGIISGAITEQQRSQLIYALGYKYFIDSFQISRRDDPSGYDPEI